MQITVWSKALCYAQHANSTSDCLTHAVDWRARALRAESIAVTLANVSDELAGHADHVGYRRGIEDAARVVEKHGTFDGMGGVATRIRALATKKEGDRG